MNIADYDYNLPDAYIARYPASARSSSRLLYYQRHRQWISHQYVYQLPELLQAGDVLVFNDTKVIAARLFGRKATGGQVEILIERVCDQHEVLAFVKSSHAPKIGSLLYVNHLHESPIAFEVLGRKQELFILRLQDDGYSLASILDTYGHIPIPSYFNRADDALDRARYQTVYAKHPGAVAAPTAGLHFDEALLTQLAAQGIELCYITLHVGAGTFAPVRVDDIRQHKMHEEFFAIDSHTLSVIQRAKTEGRRVIAVGTTTVRVLETIAQDANWRAQQGMTNIFIYPGFEFKICDGLITNFHLPRSTLLMLVDAFIGASKWRTIYATAIAEHYRFYSYGDAMLITE